MSSSYAVEQSRKQKSEAQDHGPQDHSPKQKVEIRGEWQVKGQRSGPRDYDRGGNFLFLGRGGFWCFEA
jgi:hypothetical protein